MLHRVLLAGAVVALTPLAFAADQAASQQQVSPADVHLLARPSFALLHNSLNGFPAVPAGGVLVAIECTITADGALSECRQECPCTDAATTFGPVALERANVVRVGTTSKRGEAIAGKRLALDTVIQPLDRFENPTVDFARSDQLIFTLEPSKKDTRAAYPENALDAGVEAIVDLGCIVQPDLSAQCPDIRVTTLEGEPTNFAPRFAQASEPIIKRFRIAPTTKDGKSAVGTGFRKRVAFRLR